MSPHLRLLALFAALLLLSACTGTADGQAAQAEEADIMAATADPAEEPSAAPEPVEEPAAEPDPAEEQDSHAAHGAEPSESTDAPADTSGAIVVSLVDIAFEPERLELVAGEEVLLTARNDGMLEHDIDLPEAGLHLHPHPGEEESATIRIDEPGTYEAQCLIAGHAAAGMVMEVIVR